MDPAVLTRRWLSRVLAAACLAAPPCAWAERIKDLAAVQGARSNQLIGYGIVAGLDNSGDQTTQTPFTVQSVINMLSQLGVNLPIDRLSAIQLKNVAAVTVTATLPPFAGAGQPIDVVVSSLGNAKSLRGGTLLMTPLKGADGEIYALAQGNVVVGGAGAAASGSKVQINHLSAGRVPAGATVERPAPAALNDGPVRIELHSADFGTVSRVAEAINARFGSGVARALDGRAVRVSAPLDPDARIAFIGELEALEVTPTLSAAKVIVNSRTGSIVMNQTVMVEACAIAHGSLSVVVTTEPVISQPSPFSERGETVVAQRSDIQVRQEPGALMLVPRGAVLSDIVHALNALGATPLDLVSILQAMKAAGALRAELEVI